MLCGGKANEALAQLDYIASRYGLTSLEKDRILKLLIHRLAYDASHHYHTTFDITKKVLALTDRETFKLLYWAGITIDDSTDSGNILYLNTED